MPTKTIDLDTLPPGRALRVRRMLAGMTQAELADRVGTIQPRIADAERDTTRVLPYLETVRERVDAELSRLEGAAP